MSIGNDAVKCKSCPKRGYYKNGFCVQCRPKCTHCGKRIDAPKGVLIHKHCLSQKQRWEGDGKRGTLNHTYNDCRAYIRELNT